MSEEWTPEAVRDVIIGLKAAAARAVGPSPPAGEEAAREKDLRVIELALLCVVAHGLDGAWGIVLAPERVELLVRANAKGLHWTYTLVCGRGRILAGLRRVDGPPTGLAWIELGGSPEGGASVDWVGPGKLDEHRRAEHAAPGRAQDGLDVEEAVDDAIDLTWIADHPERFDRDPDQRSYTHQEMRACLGLDGAGGGGG